MLSDEELMNMMDPGAGFSAPAGSNMPSPIPLPAGITIKKEVHIEQVPEEHEESKDAKGKTIWTAEPSFDDQYTKYPNFCRLVGPQVAIYDLTSQDQLNSLNKMLLKQQPTDAPSIVVISKKENFYEGKWLVVLEYYNVEYKKLISTS